MYPTTVWQRYSDGSERQGYARIFDFISSGHPLDLQINLLTEEKVARILELLGERPASTDGQDDLTKPTDAAALLDVIKKTADE